MPTGKSSNYSPSSPMANEGNLVNARELRQPKGNGPTQGKAKVEAYLSLISSRPPSTLPIRSSPSPSSQGKYTSTSKDQEVKRPGLSSTLMLSPHHFTSY